MGLLDDVRRNPATCRSSDRKTENHSYTKPGITPMVDHGEKILAPSTGHPGARFTLKTKMWAHKSGSVPIGG